MLFLLPPNVLYNSSYMVDTLPNPWSFFNGNKSIYSPNGKQRLQFGELQERNQGGPLWGNCNWVQADGIVVPLPGIYGGPPVWDTMGHRVALPRWTRFSCHDQQLALLDTQLCKLIVFKQGFSVLHLQNLNKLVLTGVDSPIHRPQIVHFMLATEAIQRVFEL